MTTHAGTIPSLPRTRIKVPDRVILLMLYASMVLTLAWAALLGVGSMMLAVRLVAWATGV